MKNIEPLHAGDRVTLVATARAVSPAEIMPAMAMLRLWGLEVHTPSGLFDRCGQLAGTDEHRAAMLQAATDDPQSKAILCCRGGYGTVRIVDRVDFSPLATRPQWIIGYSDATVLHSHLHATLGLPTLHATMPINFSPDGQPTPATESLRRTLMQGAQPIQWQAAEADPVELEGVEVVGGNLSILYSLLGSPSQIDTRGKALLIEDLDEYLYHIDRMMQALLRAGMLSGVRALIVGGLTQMHDNSTPFGADARQIVRQAAARAGCPVLFDAPIGHLGSENRAIVLGQKMNICADGSKKCRIFAP